jgi:hypothetical protein
MTPQIAIFLLALLNEQQVPVSNPNFLATATLIHDAKTALTEIATAEPADD